MATAGRLAAGRLWDSLGILKIAAGTSVITAASCVRQAGRLTLVVRGGAGERIRIADLPLTRRIHHVSGCRRSERYVPSSRCDHRRWWLDVAWLLPVSGSPFGSRIRMMQLRAVRKMWPARWCRHSLLPWIWLSAFLDFDTPPSQCGCRQKTPGDGRWLAIRLFKAVLTASASQPRPLALKRPRGPETPRVSARHEFRSSGERRGGPFHDCVSFGRHTCPKLTQSWQAGACRRVTSALLTSCAEFTW